jgi:hypothetical protein
MERSGIHDFQKKQTTRMSNLTCISEENPTGKTRKANL